MILVIGNRNYSSWSLRPWLLMSHVDMEFEIVDIALSEPGTARELARWSPTGKVPVLQDGELVVHDSLAICERIAELHPDAELWPADPAARARARAIACEMHAGFPRVRETMPMNCRRRVRGFVPGRDAGMELDRLETLLEQSLKDSGGPWLAGRFGVVDAMYAPMASRLHTYGVRVAPPVQAWIDALLELPAMREWYELAAAEPATIASSEVPDAGDAASGAPGSAPAKPS